MYKNIIGLHLGSGGNRINGFYNLDADPYCDCDINCNVEYLKFSNDSVKFIYNSHIFEHINYKMARSVLQEWHRVLKPGGILYISVPDCEMLFNLYLNNLSSYEVNTHSIVDQSCSIIFGGQSNHFDFHKNGYSFITLSALLQSVGFTDIKRFDRKSLIFTASFADAALGAEIQGIPISLNIEATK